jgi:hypothetical protein
MADDGRLLVLGAIGAVTLLGAAASKGSRSASSKVWIHYDAVAKEEIAKLTESLNGMVARGMSRREADRLLAEAMRGSPEVEQRGMMFVNGFLEAGQQVFVVGPHLEELFENTSLDRVPREALKAPHKAFWIALPESDLRLWSRRNGWCKLRGMYVDARDPKQIRLQVYGPVPTAAEPHATNESYLYIDFEEAYVSRGAAIQAAPDRTSEKGTGDLEAYLVGKLTEAIRMRSLAIPADILAEVTSTQIQALRIAVNLMLYTNASGAELTPDASYLDDLAQYKKLMAEKKKLLASNERERTKRREMDRLDARLAKLSGATVVRLGQSIETRNESLGSSVFGRRRRHWVRGHWRLPARKHGEPKLVWVQPYERNTEEEARVTRHVYKGDSSEN